MDNGNFAGLLLTLRAGLLELAEKPWPTAAAFSGLRDTLQALRDLAMPMTPADGKGVDSKLVGSLDDRARQPALSLAGRLCSCSTKRWQWRPVCLRGIGRA